MSESRAVFLFPNPLQLERIVALSRQVRLTPVVVTFDPLGADAAVERLSPGEFAEWMRGRRHDRVMCCHEVGIYFLATLPELHAALAFSSRCFDLLTKLQAAEALRQAGVRVAPKHVVAPGDRLEQLAYPLVVKPNFGFASLLVKRVTSPAELRRYLESAPQQKTHSLLARYRGWFDGSDRLRHPDLAIVEPDLSHLDFLSVPFVVSAGSVRAFPVLGERCSRDPMTDFEWRAFAAPVSLTPGQTRAIEDTLQRLVRGFTLGDGVFEVELLLDGEASPYVLEFSPRITGGSIPQLIEHALGVDLERAAVALFLGLPADVEPRRSVFCRLQRRERTSRAPSGCLLHRSEKTVGDRHYVDEIVAVDTATEAVA